MIEREKHGIHHMMAHFIVLHLLTPLLLSYLFETLNFFSLNFKIMVYISVIHLVAVVYILHNMLRRGMTEIYARVRAYIAQLIML